jgi:hypothetical protein
MPFRVATDGMTFHSKLNNDSPNDIEKFSEYIKTATFFFMNWV